MSAGRRLRQLIVGLTKFRSPLFGFRGTLACFCSTIACLCGTSRRVLRKLIVIHVLHDRARLARATASYVVSS